MKARWIIPIAMGFAFPVMGATPITTDNVMNHPAVYQAHNKWPGSHRHDSGGDDEECHENHHLQPDGDHDCDDGVTRGVPEPATLGLLGIGLGGLFLANRRKKQK